MRHIFQRYMSDCWPTCVAMVAGISHRHALFLVHPFHVKGGDYYTYDEHAVFVLRFLGFKVRKRYVKDFTKLKQIAVLVIDGPEYQGSGHVVVWDPETKKIMDPAKKHQNSDISYYQSKLEYAYLIS